MKKSVGLVAALGLLAVVAPVGHGVAMAKAPVYQAAGPQGGVGYSTTALENGRYVVTYTGDTRMKKDQVANFALLRAAEFTQEKGFEWFAVIGSTVREVEAGSSDDLAGRTGNFMGHESASGGAGSDLKAGAGGGDGNVQFGPTTGGFGGGDVPPSVLERWRPRTSEQAVLIIQMGNGDQANFEGVTKQPEIFEAKSTAEEIRESIKK